MTQTNKEMLNTLKDKWNDVYPDDALKSVRIHHVSPRITNNHKFLLGTKVPENGITVVVFETQKTSYFTFSVCVKADMFNRSKGVQVALGYLENNPANLTNILDLVSKDYLERLASRIDNQKSIAIAKIVAYVTRTQRFPETNDVKEISKGYRDGEQSMLRSIKNAVEKDGNATCEFTFGHIRIVKTLQQTTKLILSCNYNEDEHNLYDKGGITYVIATVTDTVTNKRTAIISYSRCSINDNFNKTIGRFYAIKAMSKKGYDLEITAEDDSHAINQKALNFLSQLTGQSL